MLSASVIATHRSASVIATHRSEWVSFNDDTQCTAYARDAAGDHANYSPASLPSLGDVNYLNHAVQQSSSSIQDSPLVRNQHNPVCPTQTAAVPSGWIRFDDQLWPNLSPLHLPSTDSRRPPPLEGSWATHFEEPNNPNLARSDTDLHSTDTDDLYSNSISRSESPDTGSLSLHNGTSMETVNRLPDNMQLNGCRMSTARFSTWVTFDDDRDLVSPVQSPALKVGVSHNYKTEKDKTFHGPQTGIEKTASKNNLVDFSAEEKDDVFALISPTVNPFSPVHTTNPFLDEALRDVQPSPINPFRAFFDQNEKSALVNSLPNASPIFQQQNVPDSPFSDANLDCRRDSLMSHSLSPDPISPGFGGNLNDQNNSVVFRNSPDLVSPFPAVNNNVQRDSGYINSPNAMSSFSDVKVSNQRESIIFTNTENLISPFSDVKTSNQRNSVFMNSADPITHSATDVKINNQKDSIMPFGQSPDTSIYSSHINGQRNSFMFSNSLNPTFTDDSMLYCSHLEALNQLKQTQVMDPDQPDSPPLYDDPLYSPETESCTFSFNHLQPKGGWPMMLRIPEKKNIMSSRHWGPICVKMLDNACLQLFYEKGLEKPFREVQLLPCHELSELKLQNFDENGKIHTIRIDQVLYKEKRKYHPMLTVVQAPVRVQVMKLGTTSYEDYESFVTTFRDVLMKLPSARDICANYFEEEITLEVQDEFRGLVAKADNKLIQHSVVTHVSVLAFVSGMPECRIGFNDVQMKGKEVVSRHDIIPTTTTKWIKMSDCQFHKCVAVDEFSDSRFIKFLPLDGHRFELMRFRTTFGEKTLPFSLKTLATVKGAEVELQSWLVMSSGFVSNQDQFAAIPCENVMIRYPVPTDWVKNFRREGVLREKSLKAIVNRSASFGSTSVSGSEPVMRVTLGSAKYEHAFKAIVWRINRLPDKNSASGHPHSFYCHLELGSDREVPVSFVHYVDVEFDMPSASASKAAVRSVGVGNKSDVRKWVVYKAHYSYQVEMEQRKVRAPDVDSMETDLPDECIQQ
ncbi:stonin-2 isoform X1 [Scyliorhinus canicula]|uniref:stonin-2 isoform X1 n=2 Tax=Scyliorhinus canicula TaxID=7830 RepID=UPI0018F5FED9|nr:stonin-2 isoform X1 [Scyliorhinus canicula]XP_038629517.1 stonin-2 isoform X1 [Scyliorhinus canicula]XP_038629526.1 stonin-2 isoform X1 [Scyliorhinus canicula]